jgi:hypothetical protein
MLPHPGPKWQGSWQKAKKQIAFAGFLPYSNEDPVSGILYPIFTLATFGNMPQRQKKGICETNPDAHVCGSVN